MNNDRSPFSLAEWGAIAAIILVWGVNNVAAKVATQELPPLFMGGARFAIALVFLLPILVRPPWPPWRQTLPLMLLAGPLHFGLVYIAFAMAQTLSPLVVALQLWIPMTTFFAWRILGETMPRAAILGMIVAFAGVAFMTLDPKGGADLPAICIGVVASALWALATVLMRRTTTVRPLKLQALTSLAGAPVLLGASAFFEPHVVERAAHASLFVWGLVVWAAVASTIGATALLFWLVQRREAGRVTPWFLLTPLVSCTFGVLMLHDRLSVQLVLGGGATLVGVALVALAERRAVAAASVT
ncbi:O-acetylserine/cysteine efflux transporter [Caulobacter ginsengisoli]|uniref:O-acetylserine/cysteine efflux transporter n=1 Tax=Caulobacter ginsengisoli TaxID=400775 RepID=A0ABU0IR95_9CAUL|nr:DMT family transporter [Caulobacter ginsengisoli]MDQ0463935.1 O-acetylserine/cysteine efflux transporter [Caulobacter ginsengisoli]